MLLYSAREQQLCICISVGKHLCLVRGTLTKNQPITVLVLLSESLGIYLASKHDLNM